MTTRERPQPNCSIARTLDLVGDRWAFLILREAHNGVTRFETFRDRLGIARNILTARLTALVDAGILERVPYQEEGSRTRWSYELTSAGQDLKLVLAALQQWGDVHVPREAGPTVIRRNTTTDEELSLAFVDPAGHIVPDNEVAFVPVPGGPADWR